RAMAHRLSDPVHAGALRTGRRRLRLLSREPLRRRRQRARAARQLVPGEHDGAVRLGGHPGAGGARSAHAVVPDLWAGHGRLLARVGDLLRLRCAVSARLRVVALLAIAACTSSETPGTSAGDAAAGAGGAGAGGSVGMDAGAPGGSGGTDAGAVADLAAG